MDNLRVYWANLQSLVIKSYQCGFCGDKVSSQLGLPLVEEISLGAPIKKQIGGIYLCPSCSKFTEFSDYENYQFPRPKFGHTVRNLPAVIEHIYNEARNCISLECYTTSVMVSRKILMNLSVSQGAEAGKRFVYYVDFLQEKGFLTPSRKRLGR